MIPLLIYLAGFIYVFYILTYDKDIQMTALTSFLFNEEFAESNKGTLSFLYSLVWPVTIFFILRLRKVPSIKLNIMRIIKNIVAFVIVIVVLWGASYILENEVNYYNQSVNIEQTFNQQKNQRLMILDKMQKVLEQKLQIAGINDSSYYKNLTAITFMRKDGASVAWKWIKETNPNSNYEEVSQLYKDLSVSIQTERTSLLAIENECQETVKRYSILHKQFPTNIYLYYQKPELDYTPIASDANRETNTTGRDNNIKL